MRPAFQDDDHTWNVSPRAVQHRRFSWGGGTFETARRAHTASVEGAISSSHPIVMATLRGGARRHEFVTDCGYRYAGRDHAGMVSFLPAGCERRLMLSDVQWEWASLALSPELVAASLQGVELPAFSSAQDPFLFGLLCELERLLTEDGELDPAYCDTVSLALAHYLRRRYAGGQGEEAARCAALPARHLRRIADYIDAHLDEEIRIAALAGLVGLSEGHLHRSFRAATGQTPLQFLNERRVQRAARILAEETASIVDVALRVGFVSPSHFARVFRSVTGENPSRHRRVR